MIHHHHPKHDFEGIRSRNPTKYLFAGILDQILSKTVIITGSSVLKSSAGLESSTNALVKCKTNRTFFLEELNRPEGYKHELTQDVQPQPMNDSFVNTSTRDGS